jgi:hypothetical protein
MGRRSLAEHASRPHAPPWPRHDTLPSLTCLARCCPGRFVALRVVGPGKQVVSCRDEQLNMVQAFEERCRTSPDTHSCFGSGGTTTIASGTEATQDSFRKMKKEQVGPDSYVSGACR